MFVMSWCNVDIRTESNFILASVLRQGLDIFPLELNAHVSSLMNVLYWVSVRFCCAAKSFLNFVQIQA